MERRIAAILAADMVGYSRLIELDEGDTLARQKRHRLELIDPTIERFHGNIVKLTGDGLIAEFGSVIEAVQCAVAIQNAMPVREEDQPEDRRIQYRVAVNLGDVVFEDGDVYGDGVNIAARLEQIADPGGVVVSGTAYDLLKSNVDAQYVPLGEKRLKNIATPVRVYQVVDKGKSSPSGPQRPRILSIATAAIAIAALALVAGTYWWAKTSSTEVAATAPASELPSIVVLPLDNLSGDAAQDYFANGLTEDITTDLSQLPQLFVISRYTAFTYAEQQVDPRTVSAELGVRYVLEGSVRRVGETLRINVQLVDGTTGGHLWAQRYDGSPNDVLTFQDRVIENVVAALPVHLEIEQMARADHGGTQNPKAFDAYLQGWDHYNRRTPEDLKKAADYFERAVEVDPSYGRAHAALAATYWEAFDHYWFAAFDLNLMELRQLRRLAERSLELARDSRTGLARQVEAEMHGVDGKIEEMLAAADDAVLIDPNDPDGHVMLAQAETLFGRHSNALTAIERAMVLDPKFPAHYLSMKGIILFNLGQFEEAADILDRALDRNSSLTHAIPYRLAAYVKTGRPFDDARRNLMLRSYTIDGLKLRWRYRMEEDWNTLADALRKADIP
ncbi:MAG: adenylate/guanylate cyclase domain-containing protein [Rhizobiaceae bacterium]